MQTTISILLAALLFSSIAPLAHAAAPPNRPNIVFILADDLGYGDLACLNKDGKIKTPCCDKLASQGMIFTDAHSASAVCTPTRYGVLTGRYPWRTRLKSGVLGGYSPALIDAGRMTVASMLKQNGYHTAAIGKWHLGMAWGDPAKSDDIKNDPKGELDYTKPIAHGPTTVGFDYYWGIAASLDMPPYIWIHNDRTVGVPTVRKKWLREGPAHKDFEAVDVLPTLTQKAVEYIDQRAKENKPFFLYLPLNSPHTPIVPDKNFEGKSGISPYADFVMQTDWTVGQVLDALDRNKLADNTLIIFTSDNGCSPSANFKQLAEHGHNPSYVFRGMKSDIFEGGHHIPFIARWPGKVKAGSSCNDTICLNDLMATCAQVIGFKLPDNAGEDSFSILPDLLGTAAGPVREATIHASINGSLSIRQGKWKLELCPGSGGWSSPKAPKELQGLPPVQLYDVTADISERKNVQSEHPDEVERLTKLLQSYIDNGRSTPGAAQKNDTPTKIHPGKSGKGQRE